MKHLLTLAALLVSTLSLAQFTPYNPDSDNDQFVGAQDLLAFLPLFGEDWDLDSLVIYELSQLQPPIWCDDPLNGACSTESWLEVPQDADILIMDAPNNKLLALPAIAKPIIVLGCDDAFLTNYIWWFDQDQDYLSVPTINAGGLNSRAFMFLGFGGQYYSFN